MTGTDKHTPAGRRPSMAQIAAVPAEHRALIADDLERLAEGLAKDGMVHLGTLIWYAARLRNGKAAP